MFIDTHCHFKMDEAYQYIENAKESNVQYLINASEDLKSSKEILKICEKFSNVFACVGVHPSCVLDFNYNLEEFRDLLNNKCVKAIGEIGLDYHYGKETIKEQKEVFRMFLSLAQEYNLPVVVHSREATKDTLDILKEYKVKGVIHCFSGSVETAKEYIKNGFLIGIGGVLTFKNSKLFEVVKKLPLSSIVLETDAPYLTPEPYRKYKNESKYIPIIAQHISKYKGVSLEEVERVTTMNASRLFDI